MKGILINLLLFFTSILPASAEEPFRIGVIYGFTGAAQVWSEYGKMGLELARDEINESGGIHGRKIELLFEDSKTNPTESVAAYRKLVTVDHVNGVIGNVWSFITNPLIPLSERDHMVLISPTVMDASVEKKTDYMFTMGYRIESERAPVDSFFKLRPEVKKVAIICWDDAWGLAHLKLWKEVIAANGVTIVDEICQNDFSSDYRSAITRVAAKKPDAIMAGMHIDRIAARIKEQGLKSLILSGSDVLEAVRMRGADDLLEGAYFTNWRASPEFEKKFRARFGNEPLLEAHNHYETLRSIARGLQNNPDNLRQGLVSVKYQGVAGPIDFTSGPFVNHGEGGLYRVRDGNFELALGNGH